MKKEQKILIDVIDMDILGRDIACAASCSGFDTCKRVTPACLPHLGRSECVHGFPEIDDVLEVKSDPFNTIS